MNEPRIRLARREDALRLAAFLKGMNYFHRLETLSPEQVAAQVDRHLALCLADPSHSVYVAETVSGEPVGYANVHWLPYLFLPGPEGYVSELFVSETARGQGIGSALLRAVKEEAETRGCSRLSLLNMRGRESYQRAFYAKDGWEERADAANFVFEMMRR
jgi:GNAT superfamily N-acetyltransferase